MAVYLIMLMVSVISFALISGKKTTLSVSYRSSFYNGKIYLQKTDLAVFLAALPFALISGFRYAVGTDYWPTYYTGFYRILNNIDFDQFEFGYLAIVKLIQKFTDNAFVLIFCLSFLFIYFTFKAIKDQSQDIPFSIVLLFVTRYFFISMNAVRQFLAMAVLLYCLKYVLSGQKRRFLFWMFIAFSIHYMSILFLPIYFVFNKKIDPSKFVCYVAIATVVILGLKNIGFRILANTRFGQVDRYDYAGIKFTLFTIALNALICFTFYLAFDEKKDDPRYRLYLNIELIAMIISIFISAIPAMERVYWIYSFPLIISIPYCVKKNEHPILRWIIIIAFMAYLIYDIIILNDHSVLPYQTVFGHESQSILWGYQVK